MAYPDAPEQRLAYDLDGTIVVKVDPDGPSFIREFPSTDVANFNNEHNTKKMSETTPLDADRFQWHFPGPRDLFGVWAGGGGEGATESFFINTEYSADTRSWHSGSWSAAGASFTTTRRIWDTWRTDIQTFDAPESWGFRGVSGGAGGLEFIGKVLRMVHIYGALTDEAHPDRVIVLDKGTGLELALHDWGDQPRGTSDTKVLQVKNNSSINQANVVSLSFDSLNSHNPDTWHELDDGGAGYSSALTIDGLAADTTYGNDITMKVTVPSSANMGPWTNRLVVGVGGWGTELSAEVKGYGNIDTVNLTT